MNTKNILLAITCAVTMIACTDKKEDKKVVTKQSASIDLTTPMLAMNTPKTTKTPVKTVETPVVFISGIDKDSNKYYTKAKDYFGMKGYTIIDNLQSLSQIINWLNKNADDKVFNEIHIVSHSNSWRGMSLRDVEEGQRITDETLTQAINEKRLPNLKNVVSKNTKIVFHSCGLGNNKTLLQTLKKALSAQEVPALYASPYFNVFGSEYADHYLANAFYNYYPTANSPGKVDLAKEFAKLYPEQDINWLSALKKRAPQYVGGVYSYKFNIPVEWDITFSSKEDIPNFKSKDDLLDFIAENDEIAKELEALKIPIEKFRWNEHTIGNRLIIEGKTTVVCVLVPEMSFESPAKYMEPTLDNKHLYEVL